MIAIVAQLSYPLIRLCLSITEVEIIISKLLITYIRMDMLFVSKCDAVIALDICERQEMF